MDARPAVDRDKVLADRAADAMEQMLDRLSVGDIEVRNGREAAEVMRALNEVRATAKAPQGDAIHGDRLVLIAQARDLVELAHERERALAAVPEPERPVIDTTLADD